MKIIEKYQPKNLINFDWLDFNYLPDSEGFKFEIYFKDSKNLVTQSISFFYVFFYVFLNDILVRTFNPAGKWGNFCLGTWDIHNDRYDYFPDNKDEFTASYLAMLLDNEIEPNYSGFCKCFDWDKFLYVILNCIMEHKAPYSLMFYVPNHEFVFYFHHSGSLGIYYKQLNDAVKSIIQKVKKEGLEIKNTNDKVVALLVSTNHT